jgi:hypothetical protein
MSGIRRGLAAAGQPRGFDTPASPPYDPASHPGGSIAWEVRPILNPKPALERMLTMDERIESAQRLDGVLRQIGYALWQLQELEATVAGYVVVRLRDTRGIGAERGAQISASVEKRPLGQLLRELIPSGVISLALAERLETLLEDRNWLVHRSRRGYRGVLADKHALSSLMSRLEDIADRSLALTKEIGREFEEYVVSSGVSREIIDSEAEKLVRSWERAQ